MENLSDIGETQTGQSRAKVSDVAWLAGIIDGEGCFSVTHGGKLRRSITPRCAVGNTNAWLMEECQRIIEEITGKRFKIKTKTSAKNHIFILEMANGPALLALIEAILPHLRAKMQQARETAAFIRSRLQRAHYHDPYTAWEKGLPKRLKYLNKAHLIPSAPGVETEREAPRYSN